jgi:ABC-2 type transport system ATP-binding protein
MPGISCQNIGKKYKDVVALNNINVEIEQGELFGFIGPDGAGKTSLFRILTSLLLPDSGHAIVEGFDVVIDYKEIRKIIGYMPGRFSLYQDLSVEENLKFYATVFGTTVEENYYLIKDIYSQIEPFKKRLAGKLSGGMKQKLALSCALVHKPEVLILDEPTTGVDAVSRKEFWEMLRRLKDMGITIAVSTPYMDEASLCDRVALIQKGEIMQIDTPQKIIDSFGEDLYAVSSNNIYKLLNDLKENPQIKSVFPFGQNVHITLKETFIETNVISKYLENKSHQNIQIIKIKANIEDCFMKLMMQ